MKRRSLFGLCLAPAVPVAAYAAGPVEDWHDLCGKSYESLQEARAGARHGWESMMQTSRCIINRKIASGYRFVEGPHLDYYRAEEAPRWMRRLPHNDSITHWVTFKVSGKVVKC